MLPAERLEVGNLRNMNTPSALSYTFSTEYGHADVKITKVNSHVDRLFAGLGDGISVFMSHFDKLISLPTACETTETPRLQLLT